MQGSRSSDELVALQFDKVDDANVTGGVAINSTDSDGASSIVVSVQAILEEARRGEEEPFVLGKSKEVPQTFPSEIPVYPGATIVDTAWLRSPGNTDFAVTLLTEDGQSDVIDFYRGELSGLGWDVVDEEDTGFALVISFSDENDELSGSVSADVFADDESYTQVDIQVSVASSRRQGN